MSIEAIILAAGQGTRMRSKLPKVLHAVAGKPMVQHVIDTVKQLDADKVHIVIGHGADTVQSTLSNQALSWVTQEQQLGTGHAVAQALPSIADESIVLIAYGDVPLASVDTLAPLIQQAKKSALALLTVNLEDPTGYGRIVRDAHQAITQIVEQKDASTEELLIQEVNTGIMALPARYLKTWIPQLSSDNAQGEYYLTDIIAMAVNDGVNIVSCHPHSEMEVQGANNREQLSHLERFYQQREACRLMMEGVSLADPNRIDVRGQLQTGQDVFIDSNCLFIGDVELGDDVSIGPNCVIENTKIGSGCTIKSHSVLEEAILEGHCTVGPFARLRPGTRLSSNAKIGNFVETKKAHIGEGSKVNHLSYVGDCLIGEQANIGAGTITCNYDGANKFETIIGDGAFIGSNTALVAPVTIEQNATVGAGSTISSHVEKGQLAVARAKQRNINNWKRPQKIKKD